MTYTLYLHRFPNGKVYIGCTSQSLSTRFGRNGEGYKAATRVWDAIVEFGWENITHEVLRTVKSRFEASRLEKQYIEEYHAIDPDFGYNTKPGGLGKPLPPVKPDVSKRISEMKTGCIGIRKDGLNFFCKPDNVSDMLANGYELGWYSPEPEVGKKISEGKTGSVGIHRQGKNKYVRPEEVQSYLNLGWELGGEPQTESAKQHLREVNLGKKYSNETREKLSKIRKGTVLIHQHSVNKRVRPEQVNEYLNSGWELGASDDWKETNRKAMTGQIQSEETKKKRANSLIGKNVGRKHIHKGDAHKMVFVSEIDKYLSQGWILGRPKAGGKT